MALDIAFFLAGCVLLYFGAEWLVRGAAAIAESLGIPKTIVGLTLVAFGTSAPELFFNVIAGFRGETGIALANVSGSNLTNICVGFGLCGIISGVYVRWSEFREDCITLIASAAFILAMLMFFETPHVPMWAIAPLFVMMAMYLLSLRRRTKDEYTGRDADMPLARMVIELAFFFGGTLALACGGWLVLESAIKIAEVLQLSKELIGLTIVAAGTSIPDTVASVVAARRGEHEIAVGNLLGSNISNVLVVLTGTTLAGWTSGKPVVFDDTIPFPAGTLVGSTDIVVDYVAVCIVSLLFIGMAAFAGRVRRPAAVILLLLYFGYMGVRVFGALADRC
jgi:cation:H+ antiporter